MTEEEWLTGDHPRPMLDALLELELGVASERKCRLIAAAFCRSIGDLLQFDDRLPEAIRVSEAYADGLASAQELDLATACAEEAALMAEFLTDRLDAAASAVYQAILAEDLESVSALTTLAPAYPEDGEYHLDASIQEAREKAQADMIRDILGNPFRPPVVRPEWLTPAVIELAAAIDRERDFDPLPILGDALEEAGCDDQRILDHCRSGGAHELGCWVIDSLLGKS